MFVCFEGMFVNRLLPAHALSGVYMRLVSWFREWFCECDCGFRVCLNIPGRNYGKISFVFCKTELWKA